MASQIKTYMFEIGENVDMSAINALINGLTAVTGDESLKIEERRQIMVTTNRPNVATMLEALFEPAIPAKRTWKRKPEKTATSLPEPGGIAPYQGG